MKPQLYLQNQTTTHLKDKFKRKSPRVFSEIFLIIQIFSGSGFLRTRVSAKCLWHFRLALKKRKTNESVSKTSLLRGSETRVQFFAWSAWRDLNPRPHGPEPCALPTALHADILLISKYVLISIIFYKIYFILHLF